jgi:CPA1 family monovalent cation:H+ antiporter
LNAQKVIGVLLSITALSSFINYKYIKLPKSIGVTLVTLVLTLLVTVSGKIGWNLDELANNLLDGIGFNETFLHGMLSFLLFSGSLHINVMELSKHKVLVASLATFSVIISTVLIGYATFGLSKLLGIDLPFYYCFVFGALISPTDPIAVLGILKKVKARKSLEMKIAGEALFNDGMGIVLFFVTSAIASGKQDSWHPLETFWFFMQQGVGGILVGAVMGYLASKLLRTIDDYEVAIILTLAIVTGGYTLALGMNVSGPICMVIAGLMVGDSVKKGVLSPDAMRRLDSFWELVDEIMNAVLFVLIGLEFMCIRFDLKTLMISIGAIVISIAARWFSISIPVASLTRFRSFNSDVMMVMTWGGLRGGISIALALGIQGPWRDLIVSITYAVVLFSMMVQGLTIGPLVKKLASDASEAREKNALDVDA